MILSLKQIFLPSFAGFFYRKIRRRNSKISFSNKCLKKKKKKKKTVAVLAKLLAQLIILL